MHCGDCRYHSDRCGGYCSHFVAQVAGTSGKCGNAVLSDKARKDNHIQHWKTFTQRMIEEYWREHENQPTEA